jgi:hypothetical protein
MTGSFANGVPSARESIAADYADGLLTVSLPPGRRDR